MTNNEITEPSSSDIKKYCCDDEIKRRIRRSSEQKENLINDYVHKAITRRSVSPDAKKICNDDETKKRIRRLSSTSSEQEIKTSAKPKNENGRYKRRRSSSTSSEQEIKKFTKQKDENRQYKRYSSQQTKLPHKRAIATSVRRSVSIARCRQRQMAQQLTIKERLELNTLRRQKITAINWPFTRLWEQVRSPLVISACNYVTFLMFIKYREHFSGAILNMLTQLYRQL
jgi:hypothetical protein